jgi:hypothetical protein
MNRLAQACRLLTASTLVGACAYQPTIQHPALPALAPIESTMDCSQIDLAIDRADTVRWVIREDGGKLETDGEQTARNASNVVLFTLGIFAGVVPTLINDSGDKVLNAADVRILGLLQLKRERNCPPRATALQGIDDRALLLEFDATQAQLDAGSGEQSRLFDERTRLLDGLRVLPSSATSPP